MDGPGTISWDEFLANAESFIIVSDQISDGWQLRGNKVIIFNWLIYMKNIALLL